MNTHRDRQTQTHARAHARTHTHRHKQTHKHTHNAHRIKPAMRSRTFLAVVAIRLVVGFNEGILGGCRDACMHTDIPMRSMRLVLRVGLWSQSLSREQRIIARLFYHKYMYVRQIGHMEFK